MKSDWLSPSARSLPSKPGANCDFNLSTNIFLYSEVKLNTGVLLTWESSSLCSKISSSGFLGSLYEVIPEKPLTQFVKETSVFPLYVIISSSIFRRPYSFGNPSVESTKIVSSPKSTSPSSKVMLTIELYVPTLTY